MELRNDSSSHRRPSVAPMYALPFALGIEEGAGGQAGALVTSHIGGDPMTEQYQNDTSKEALDVSPDAARTAHHDSDTQRPDNHRPLPERADRDRCAEGMASDAREAAVTPHWNVVPLRRGQAGGRANAQAQYAARVYDGLEPDPYPVAQPEPVLAPVRRHPQVELMREAFFAALDAGATPEEARAKAMEVAS
jgi:hypothetical protein